MRKRLFFSLHFVGEMLNPIHRYVSELLYIHTKLMIVDDRRVIVSVSLE